MSRADANDASNAGPHGIDAVPLADALHRQMVGGENLIYARFGQRAVAAVRDWAILGGPSHAAFSLVWFIVQSIVDQGPSPADWPGLSWRWISWLWGGYAFVIAVRDAASPTQGTSGKQRLDLVITDRWGQRISRRRAIVREAARVGISTVGLIGLMVVCLSGVLNRPLTALDAVVTVVLPPMLPYFTQPLTPRRQTLHDLIAGTLVLHRRSN